MTPQPSQRHISIRSMEFYLRQMSGFLLILHILSMIDVKLYTKSKSYISNMKITHCKRPDSDMEENTTYNYYVSKICICSEHTIGYLKGTWQSL